MTEINEKIAQLNEVDRFILLLLGAKNSESIPGPIHLQKEMYLLQNVFPKLAEDTGFEPWFLGPESEIVADEAEQLVMSVGRSPAQPSFYIIPSRSSVMLKTALTKNISPCLGSLAKTSCGSVTAS